MAEISNFSHSHRYDQVLRYLHQGQINLAIQGLRELLGEQPQNSLYHSTLALCLLDEKRIYAAEVEAGEGLRLKPSSPYAHYVIASVLFARNQLKNALSACHQVLQLDPEYLSAILLGAKIYHQLGNKKECASWLNRALLLDAESIETMVAYAEYCLAEKNLPLAREYVHQALALSPEDEHAHLVAGRLALDSGNSKDALYHATYVIRYNPNNERALTLICHIKMRDNWLMGLWWRFNSALSGMSHIGAGWILICGYLLFNLTAEFLQHMGYPRLSSLVTYGWLGLAIYSWFGIPIYQKMLAKELQKFRFENNF